MDVLKKIAGKFLTLIIWALNPKIPSKYRWFIKLRVLGQLNQLKYYVKDYIIKKPYKVISFHGEFQQELLHVLPFAYWHYKNGTLLETKGSKFTKELYYFSPKHSERYSIRDYNDNYNLEIPNAPHDFKLIKSKWSQVPLKSRFENEIFKYSKPILVIANRYNSEWDGKPISYFDAEMLQDLIEVLKDKYQIIYNRPPSNQITNDNSEIFELKDEQVLRSYPDVVLMTDLFDEYKGQIESYNLLQLMVYSCSSNFISIHGGTGTLASYFGGTNVILSKRGLEHDLLEFENVFPEVAGTKIVHVRHEDELIETVKKHF